MNPVERTTVQATPPAEPNTGAYTPDATEAPPTTIGRYRVETVLGEGGFGRVYLARDEQLQRPVAIKVPHAQHVAHTVDAEAYLKEARMVASLDHPQIVPVFYVGSAAGFPCFVVAIQLRVAKSILEIQEFLHQQFRYAFGISFVRIA